MYNKNNNANADILLTGTAAELTSDISTVPSAEQYTTVGAVQENTADVISVFMTSEGSVKQMKLRDYIIGVVAAEMPAAYEAEALKAQAAASVTLARYMRQKNTDNAELAGAVISTDSKKYQGYMTTEAMKERWGDSSDGYYQKLCNAVDTVINCEITYKGEPILAAFHAISSGITENAENVWSKGEEYLVSVESAGDALSPNYSSSVTISADDFGKALQKAKGDYPEGDASAWLGESAYTDAGTLVSLNVAGTGFTGSELREIFSLRSSAITISYDSGNFILNVVGYGHGVGMSQYGADYYARQGMTWQEIIAHYYPGTEITEL